VLAQRLAIGKAPLMHFVSYASKSEVFHLIPSLFTQSLETVTITVRR
jgi:hypothetical protein